VFGRKEDSREGPARRWLWEAAEALLPPRDVGDFNQALMELGALVCTPEKPDCPTCPLRQRCAAYQSGRPEDFPRRSAPAAPTPVSEVAVVIRRGGRVLLAQRPATATRWASMWEFPRGEVAEGETYEGSARRLARELTGLDVRLGPELATIRHGVTRFAITLVCFEADSEAGEARSAFYERLTWVEPAELAGFPVSSPQRRLAKLVAAEGRQRRLF
jgi:A/G-specific adenine glycosylase